MSNYKKMRVIFTLVFLILLHAAYSQGLKGNDDNSSTNIIHPSEIYFSCQVPDPDLIGKLSGIVSVDNVQEKTVYAYATPEEFAVFLTLEIPFDILPHPGESPAEIIMRETIDLKNLESWDFYPTYEGYLSMMNQFQMDYPHMCQVFSIGTSVQGRQLMMAKISKNVSVREPEPQFLYTGTIHGDELAGYVLLLRLIDYLLSNYGIDPKVTYLLDNVEIWINPLANPDGTFKGGNHTVNGSIRNNANSVDLNRNYPDPEDGPNPDGKVWQPETIAFMQLAENNNFVMSANTHGGIEVLNYPWDTWSRLTADNDWWVYVCREYVDTVHVYSPSAYMTALNNGITNGYNWYRITGGRQDYMNYFQHCRELTMELSNVKKLAASQLNNHWNWNYRSLLNYIEQVTYGVAGTITDLENGEPIVAKVEIEGHDIDNSFVYSESEFGFYQRLLEAGNYDLTFTAPGYYPMTVQGVAVSRYNKTTLNVELDAGELNPQISSSQTIVPVGSTIDFTDVSYGRPISWQWTFQGGQPAASSERHPSGILYPNAGSFDVTLAITNSSGEIVTKTFEDFVNVNPFYLMSNQTVNVCNGLFYDSGGANNNYGNNQNFTMTFVPEIAGAKLKVEFLEFSVEHHSSCGYDWLKIYDGINTSATLIGTWCGANSPGTIVAGNISGALTFQFKSDASLSNPGWKALLSCISQQSVSMRSGWSGISLYVDPENPDIENITQNLATNLIIVRGDEGIYYPSMNINTIETWNARRGYLAKLSAAGQMTIDGSPVRNKTLYLKEGWNIIPVLSSEPVSTVSVAAVLGDKFIIATDIAGFGVYWPAHEIQTLQWLQPGKAYYLKTTESVEFNFPEP